MQSEMLRLLAVHPALPEYSVGIIPNFEQKSTKNGQKVLYKRINSGALGT